MRARAGPFTLVTRVITDARRLLKESADGSGSSTLLPSAH